MQKITDRKRARLSLDRTFSRPDETMVDRYLALEIPTWAGDLEHKTDTALVSCWMDAYERGLRAGRRQRKLR